MLYKLYKEAHFIRTGPSFTAFLTTDLGRMEDYAKGIGEIAVRIESR